MLLNILTITSVLSGGISFLLKLLLLIFILGIIILVHELGHFLWAKAFKVHIYEFSIGMGPILHTHKGKDKIDYNIRAIPIGGFVSMAGEVYADDDKVPKNKLMCNKPWYQRFMILAAGVLNNFIMAIVLLILYGAIWGGGAIKPEIASVLEDSAAQKAGIEAGDTILAINDYKVGSWDKAQIILQYKNENDYYTFELKDKKGNKETIKITPEVVKNEETGVESKVFGISVANADLSNIFKVIGYGFQKFGSVVGSMAATISGLITGKIALNALSGPVGIYEVVGASFTYTFGYAVQYIIYILAFLSINVGFINILPFPAFDGGHLFFLLVEKIKGSPVNAKFENICHLIGFALIFLLMIIVTINDIIKLF